MDNINNILSSLTSSDIDMLKGVASSILGSSGQNQSDPAAAAPAPAQPAAPAQPQGSPDVKQAIAGLQDSAGALSALGNLNFNQGDFEMMMKAKSIFDRMNNAKNKNVDLIMALRPHLRPETQDKADQAMKILRLFEVLPLLKDLF